MRTGSSACRRENASNLWVNCAAGNADLDAAILDVNLAGQNSFSVANALKLRGIPFAFATGDGGVDKTSGFADPILLNKPFDFEQVKAVVGKLLAPAA
jgi:DNA-binding response OmpR family regulator